MIIANFGLFNENRTKLVRWAALSGSFVLSLQLDPPPAFLAERIKLFDKLKAEADAELQGTVLYIYLSSKDLKLFYGDFGT